MARTIGVLALMMLMCVVAVSAARQAPGPYQSDAPFIAPAPYAWAPDSSAAPEGAPMSSPVVSSPVSSPAWAPAWEPASAPAPAMHDGAATPASAPAPVRGY